MRILGIICILSLSCGRIDFDPITLGMSPSAKVDAKDKPVDAAQIIGGHGCAALPDENTLALFLFDDTGPQITDQIGQHHGQFKGTPLFTESAEGCGTAIQFINQKEDYGEIPNHKDWELQSGSIDFWLRLDAYPKKFAGIFARDAVGTEKAGHLMFLITEEGQIAVRLQKKNDPLILEGIICGPPDMPLGAWTHIGLNFGLPTIELWINGQSVDEPGMASDYFCQTGQPRPIAGNINPWAIGVSQGQTEEGNAQPAKKSLTGAIDHLRISNIRRDFSNL